MGDDMVPYDIADREISRLEKSVIREYERAERAEAERDAWKSLCLDFLRSSESVHDNHHALMRKFDALAREDGKVPTDMQNGYNAPMEDEK